MKISSIIITESRSYLYEGLDPKQKKTMFLWESAGVKLVEANLTVDQINQIFANVEQGASAAGGNRTMLGKGMDAASAVNRAWEDLKTKVQNSGPIKNVDAMYDQAAEKLKQATGGDQGVMKYVQMYRDFAKKHPIAQSLIYSALIAAAGISGAGLGGAAALGLFKMVDKLLQGEKFSSSAYQGAKTGAMAYGASKVGDYIKGKMGNAPGQNELVGKSPEELDAMMRQNELVGKSPEELDAMMRSTGRLTDKMSYDQAYNTYIQKFAQDPNNPSAQVIQQAKKFAANKAKRFAATGVDTAGNVASASIQAVRQQASQEALNAVKDAINNGMDPSMTRNLAGIAQGAIDKFGSAAGGPISQQSIETIALKAAMMAQKGVQESKKLTSEQINLIFEHVSDSTILEGITDFVKGAAGKAMNWVQTKGRNLTTTITADKLMQAWNKAGSPTDSEQVKQVMLQAGVPENIINNTYNTMKISAAPVAQPVKPKVAKPAVARKPAAPSASGAMTQMTQQLTQPTQSSTGGTITTTPAGVRHTANPNNPNASPTSQPVQNIVHKANPNNPNYKYANKTLH